MLGTSLNVTCLHFLINLGLLAGLSGQVVVQVYVAVSVESSRSENTEEEEQ